MQRQYIFNPLPPGVDRGQIFVLATLIMLKTQTFVFALRKNQRAMSLRKSMDGTGIRTLDLVRLKFFALKPGKNYIGGFLRQF